MKKSFIITLGLTLLLTLPAMASCPVNQDYGIYPQNCNMLYKDRCVVYNALNLTCEQAKIKDDLDKAKIQEMSEILPVLYKEQDCLKTLKANNAKKSEIRKQERNVKKIEKQIDKIDKRYEKEFKKHLTGLQKSKFHNIERLQKRDLKKCNKGECRELPKGMRPFAPGYGTKQNCQCEQNK